MSKSKFKVFLGSFIHSKSQQDNYVIVPDGLIGVDGNGKIVFVDTAENLETLKEKYAFGSDVIQIIGRGEFLMPGFVDSHIHAPQYLNAGLGLDLPLLEWLNKYTFPTEARFKDTDFAKSCYKKVVERTLKCGTTTASYYATIHRESSEILAEVVHAFGQRGRVGKVSMDCCSPDFYVETTEEALQSAEQFVINVLNKKYPFVKPVLTPRFALTCSRELLLGLSAIAHKYDVHIQSHLCESKSEVARALELFPDCETYTEIYEKTGILGDKTIMAHCVHMEDADEDLLKSTGTSIAHCPTSNISLVSGLCHIQRFFKKGITVGLGTDVSGGYSPSILEAARHAILMSKVIQMQDESYKPVTYRNALYLATLAGAEALGMDQEIGNFEVGKYFDALHIDLSAESSPIHVFSTEGLDEMVQKFFMLGDDRNIIKVIVAGKNVKPIGLTYMGTHSH